MIKFISLAALCSLLFLPLPCLASDCQELAPLVVTATMTEQTLDVAAGTVQLIDQQEIASLGAENVADVLLHASGITLLTGAGRSQEVSIRGLGAGHTLILLDGRRITGGFNANIDVSQIPVVMIDHIEIVRGPGSALYGSEATGGVINIITRRPAYRTEGELDARGGVGLAAEQALQGMAGSSAGPVRANLAAAHYSQDGWNKDGEMPDEIDDTDLDAVLMRSAFDFSTDQTLSIGGEWSKFTRDGKRLYKNVVRTRNGEDERWGGYLQYDLHQDGRSGGMLRVYGNRSKGSYDFDPAADEADKERGLLQAEGRGSYAPFESLTLTAGGELRWETLEGDQMINGSEDGETDKIKAIFGQADWSPLKWLNFVGSLRYDDYENSGSHLTPRIIASLYVPHGRIWASYGNGFRAATLDEMYGLTEKRQGKDLYYGNKNLDPETSQSYETGIEMHSQRLRGRLVYFHNRLDDLIEARLISSSGGYNTYEYQNVEKAKTYGTEIEAGVLVTSNLDLAVQATWLSTENEETGEPLATEPKWKGEATLTWQVPALELEAQVHYLYFGDSEDGAGEELDGYDLVSLYLSKTVTENLKLYAGSDNLFNEENDYFYQTPLQVYAGVNYCF